ncbi:uncharacterized protein LOC132034699 [Lycium ferocissimum]|uniref:uncharacterized protein LOC132034699 n=1 Tax=Lycium ferocissimum TaxID=112874 RepID=UPI0028160588|nr:uncharacterized protein LOC132034699 [Lycium ferocissimum]
MNELEEDMLLVCSIRRHGLENWEMVATEFSSAIFRRRHRILNLSPTECQGKYEDLKRRFKSCDAMDFNKDDDDEIEFVKLMEDKLIKAYIVALKEDMKLKEASIQKTALGFYKLEAEHRIELTEENGDQSIDKILESMNLNEDFTSILHVLRSHKHCCLFESRLPSQGEQHYHDQIRQHMDLQIIQNKLEQDVYSNMEIEFFRDLLLMFNNAIIYFPEETLQHSAAVELKAIVVKAMGKKPEKPEKTLVCRKVVSGKPEKTLVCRKVVSGKPEKTLVTGLAAEGNTMIQEKLPKSWRPYKPRNKALEVGESSIKRRSERVRSNAKELKNDPDYTCYGHKGERRRRNRKK